jgi:hypothetical protein
MSKGARIALFMLAASLGNVLVTGAIFVTCLGLYSLSLARILPQEAVIWAIGGSFLISLIGSILVYKRAIRFVRGRFDLDAWLGFSVKK